MSLTQKAHSIIRKKYSSIELGVDATCGNGYDTLFLASICSSKGKIFGFDIQKTAIENTLKLLMQDNLEKNVELINSGHENMDRHINSTADVIMFNLGYLPRSEYKIFTESETTMQALELSTSLIKTEGIISLICYPGHEEGKEETKEVKKWIKELDKDCFNVSEYLSNKPNESTPVLYAIEKTQ